MQNPVYLAAHPVEAAIVRNYLAGYGIAVVVHDCYSWGAAGQLPANLYPRIYVEDERDFDRARELLRRYEQGPPPGPQWHCHHCGEFNESQFSHCWNCQTGRDR